MALRKGGKENNYTQRRSYRYKLFDRDTDFNTILHAARLFQQFVDDQYLKCEKSDLKFIERN